MFLEFAEVAGCLWFAWRSWFLVNKRWTGNGKYEMARAEGEMADVKRQMTNVKYEMSNDTYNKK